MYPKAFEIKIDGDCSKFYAGQVIEGRVSVFLQKEKILRGIIIRLIGKGHVFWDTLLYPKQCFSESEIFVNTTQDLLVPEDGRQTCMPPGSYEYCFSFQLPRDIPSSMEGQHWFVRYYLEAAIQRPWKEDVVQEAIIHVTSISELNNPKFLEPISIERDKVVGINICQKYSPIIVNFMMGKSGFFPGEYLQFGADIRNTSRATKINGIHVSLRQQVTCHVKTETKTTHDKILMINGPSVEIGGMLIWQSNFKIPTLPPSQLPGCSIITLKYYMEIKLALDKWPDFKYSIPIELFTFPFQQKEQRQMSVSFMPQESPKKVQRAISRKNSMVKSPITGEFIYADDDYEQEKVAPISPLVPETNFPLFTLPPLDLLFFQNKVVEKSPYFKYHEDGNYECSYQYQTNFQKDTQPPRPQSNPGHYFGRSHFWNDDDEDE